MKKYRVIDLFAGCGGLTDGFEQSGKYITVACVEWDKAACTTLAERLERKWGYSDARKRVVRFDIQRTKELISGKARDNEYGDNHGLDSLVADIGAPDIIIGGPPCQSYSVAGRIRDEHGMHYDYRNYLFESYIKIVEQYRPRAVIFENVPGMLSAAPGGIPIVDRISKAFRASGYELIDNIKENAVIDFIPYGIPQRRKRVVLVALNRSQFEGDVQRYLLDFYNRLLPAEQTNDRITVDKALAGLPALKPSKKDYKVDSKNYSHEPFETKIHNHCPRYHNRRDIATFRQLALDIASGRNRYNSVDKLKQLYQQRTGRTSNIHKYHVLRREEPSNTIPAHLYKDGLRHIHPDPLQARSITVREAARLQTFDDDYVFKGSNGDQYKMIGNAVPPLFAEKLGLALSKLLEKHE